MKHKSPVKGGLKLVQKKDPAHRTTWVKHHRKRNFVVFLVLATLLVVIIVGLSQILAPTAQVGQQAPDFTLQDVTTNTNFHLYDHKGKPILVEFMRTTCGACVNQAPSLAQLWSSYKNQTDFVSVTIDPNGDQPSVMLQFAKDHGVSWSFARDNNLNTVTHQYGVAATPTILLLDKDCIIKYRFTGVTDLQTLSSGVQSLL